MQAEEMFAWHALGAVNTYLHRVIPVGVRDVLLVGALKKIDDRASGFRMGIRASTALQAWRAQLEDEGTAASNFRRARSRFDTRRRWSHR